MKADSKIFKGIEYVQVSELPPAQRDELSQSINRELYIKLLIDGKVIGGCLQYKDYTRWYTEFYQPKYTPSREPVTVTEVEIKANLALNKF
jgi:hypothetical protein